MFRRCDENSAKEMGLFVDACRQLQRATGAAVLLVHHTGRNEKGMERGSSSLRAAADVMIRMSKRSDGTISVSNDKQKDHTEFESLTFRLQSVTPEGAGSEEPSRASCVLVRTTATPAQRKSILDNRLLTVLRTLAEAEELQVRDWRNAAHERLGFEVPERTFGNWRTKLTNLGYVDREGELYVVQAHPWLESGLGHLVGEHRVFGEDQLQRLLAPPVGVGHIRPPHPGAFCFRRSRRVLSPRSEMPYRKETLVIGSVQTSA